VHLRSGVQGTIQLLGNGAVMLTTWTRLVACPLPF